MLCECTVRPSQTVQMQCVHRWCAIAESALVPHQRRYHEVGPIAQQSLRRVASTPRQFDLGCRGDHRRRFANLMLGLGRRGNPGPTGAVGPNSPTWCSTSAAAPSAGASSLTWCSTSAVDLGRRRVAPPTLATVASASSPTSAPACNVGRPCGIRCRTRAYHAGMIPYRVRWPAPRGETGRPHRQSVAPRSPRVWPRWS